MPDKSLEAFKPYQCIICKRTYEEGEVKKYQECAQDTCKDEKALDSVYCEKHRDMRKKQNEKQTRKRKGLEEQADRPLEVDADPLMVGAPGLMADMPIEPEPEGALGIAEINRAIKVLGEDMDALIKAKAIISKLGGK